MFFLRKGVGPMAEADGMQAAAPDLDDIEAHRHPKMAAGTQVGVRAVNQMTAFGCVNRHKRSDFVKVLARPDPPGLHFHETQLPRTAQGNQVNLATAMRRSPVAHQAVISAIFQVASGGLFADPTNARA